MYKEVSLFCMSVRMLWMDMSRSLWMCEKKSCGCV